MLQPSRLLRYRPTAQPQLHAPCLVRSVGRYMVAVGAAERRPPRGFTQLWWLDHGSCDFELDGAKHSLVSDQLFITRPDDPQSLAAGPHGAAFHFLTFDGPGAWASFTAFGLDRGTVQADPCPVSLFQEILDTIESPGLDVERRCSAAAYRILLQAARGPATPAPPPRSLAHRARALMEERFSDPRFGIAQMESLLGTHRSTLFRQCRRAFGQTPSQLLSQLRIQRGATLLRDTSLPIAEIAPLCGFSDPNYFAKAIKRHLRRPPSALRNDEQALQAF